jgi:D-xylulose reductase
MPAIALTLGQPGDYPLAIALVAAGKIDLKPLVTHRYAFEDVGKAFTTTQSGEGEDGRPAIKVLISGPGVSPDEK